MKENKVSVIMSTYNEKREWLIESIGSVLNQTYKEFEFIIVLDNPDNKEIYDIVHEFEEKDSRIKVLINKKNIGLTKSLNKAIQFSTGDIIVRMDADDVAKKNRIQLQLEYMMENDIDILGGNVQIINENNEIVKDVMKMPRDNFKIRKKIILTNCIAHPTWCIKKSVYKKLNYYRDIPMCEDYDFLLRAYKNNFKMGNIQQTVLSYRMTKNSISRSNGLKQYLTMRYLQKGLWKIENINKDNLDEYLQNSITKKRQENYSKANMYLVSALEFIKRHEYVKGFIYLLKASTKSRYFTVKSIRMALSGLI